MEEATIFDYARFMRTHCSDDNECADCPLHALNCAIEDADSEELTKINEIILNWCKEHPVKTRQSEFLKMFPNARIYNGVVLICPKSIDTTYPCKNVSQCHDCHISYWLAEAEE